jgi:predicted RNase H-like HicB family nuclease
MMAPNDLACFRQGVARAIAKQARWVVDWRFSMTRYVALVDGKPGSYGPTVPDLPGCTSAAATTDEVLRRANETVRLWAEDALADGEKLPKPRSIEALRADPWRRRLQRAPLSRSCRSSSMRAGRPRQTSRSTPACSQQSTRQPLSADLHARPSWRALRARKSKARADGITTSWARSWGSCGRPPFPIRGFRTGARQRKRLIWDFELINRRVHFCDVDRGELILRYRDPRPTTLQTFLPRSIPSTTMSIGSLLALSKISDHTTIAERGAGHSIITSNSSISRTSRIGS